MLLISFQGTVLLGRFRRYQKGLGDLMGSQVGSKRGSGVVSVAFQSVSRRFSALYAVSRRSRQDYNEMRYKKSRKGNQIISHVVIKQL